jgi:sarcosine oxidase, subunit gamma
MEGACVADLILKPLTALGHDVPEDIEIGPYLITERFDVALASVAVRRGRGDDLATAARAAGLPLPAPARAETGTPYSAFWVAPDMWFAEAPLSSHQDIAAHLKAALGDTASVTEQTDAWVRFDLSAPDLAPLLERMTNIDIATAPEGYASRTVIDHLGCYLIKRAATEITLYGPRSSAANLLHAIEVTAKSIL